MTAKEFLKEVQEYFNENPEELDYEILIYDISPYNKVDNLFIRTKHDMNFKPYVKITAEDIN